MKSIFKAAVIGAIAVVCFILLASVKGSSDSGKRIHAMIFIEDNDGWRKCLLAGCKLDETRETIVFFSESGGSRLITPIIKPGFPFSNLVLSWNAEKLPDKTALDFEVAVSADSQTWYVFQYLVYGLYDSSRFGDFAQLPTYIANIGQMATDELELDKPMKFARVTAKAAIPDDSSRIFLRRLSLCFASDNSSWSDYRDHKSKQLESPISTVKLSVPYYAQRNLPRDISSDCCSPTSVAMVLNYFDKNVDPETFSRSVYDPYHDMYGNWPYNVQAAYIAGMSKTWVEIHSGFDEIYEEIHDGKPVVISIAYGYDELPNSPVHEVTVGHLIAVVGFDGPNNVICNDPAGHGPEDGIIRYPRKELEKVWINHGGVAYHLWP